MSKPKEMGKPVADLTADELTREQSRCTLMLKVYGQKPMAKGLKKRLHGIDKRLARVNRLTLPRR